MKKLKQASIERFVQAYKKHLQSLRDEFDIDDLYGDEAITIDDFEEVGELEPYKWHPRKKWDGNPNDYWVVRRLKTDICEFCNCCQYAILNGRKKPRDDVSHFMYIEPLEMKDDAS